ncbi:hypothetical protein [Ostreibacterium oceani]|uniref:Uncharacterized protein n=1 Tax=Ostreibacterium oceani TaxID=2654998 RepID=A0A6N7EYU9_9GAMM|nr:hypothetical protein [Ostreibacterium oceani]MPV86725.1 hypothetical protein [Ostreibacterium oceani]
MQLKKIIGKESTGIYIGKFEILTIIWNNREPNFFAFGESRELRQVDKAYFATQIFGNNYKSIEAQLPLAIENYESTKDENGNQYFCFCPEGIIHGFDKNAKKILEWDADEVGQGHPIYDIAYQFPDFLWLAFPTGQTVTQVSISERKEIYRIGEYTWEDKYDPLCYPESLHVKGKFVYIPNMGNNKLFRLDSETKELELIETFEERLWQYEETDFGKFILTETGVYEIEK